MCHSSIECRAILYNLRLGLNSFHEKKKWLLGKYKLCSNVCICAILRGCRFEMVR